MNEIGRLVVTFHGVGKTFLSRRTAKEPNKFPRVYDYDSFLNFEFQNKLRDYIQSCKYDFLTVNSGDFEVDQLAKMHERALCLFVLPDDNYERWKEEYEQKGRLGLVWTKDHYEYFKNEYREDVRFIRPNQYIESIFMNEAGTRVDSYRRRFELLKHG